MMDISRVPVVPDQPRQQALASPGKMVCNSPMAESKKYEMDVKVRTEYLSEQSDEAQNRYVFAYTITITNTGNIPAQLISRHWIISDASNQVQEVRGLGVVG